MTPRAIDERPFRAEDRPWLATRSKRDDLTRPQASGVRNSSVKRSRWLMVLGRFLVDSLSAVP